MFSCRRLRSWWKHPSCRAATAILLLSLPGLILFSLFTKNMTVTRIVSAMSGETDQPIYQKTTSADFSELKDASVKPPSTYSLATLPGIVVSTSILARKESTKQEMSSPSVQNVRNKTVTQSTISLTSQLVAHSPAVSTKFLIFVCDIKTYCYGLGDRQRGLVSVFLLAEVTNRIFGINMTSPSNFNEFYKPNLVPWDIPESQLKGKSSVEIVAYGPQLDLRLHEMDFNAVYPQDVVYIRTNHKLQGALLKNPLYKDKFPPWAKVQPWRLFQVSWLRLMTPSQTLRLELNEILADIAQKMHDEYKVSEILNNSKCCERTHANTSFCDNSMCNDIEQRAACCNLTSSSTTTSELKACSNGICTEQTNNINCTDVVCTEIITDNCNIKACTNSTLPTPIANTTNIASLECVRALEEKSTNVSDLSRMKTFAMKYCNESRPVLAPWASVESIRQKQGYDKVNINLVCVHIRLGHSATLPFENNVRNKIGSVVAVWKFLKAYVAKGQHVYLATDSQEVRQQAKNIFGDRVHVSSVPIAHIAVIQKGQNERTAFSLTLVEQLLLATSCKVLVMSYSGFSMKAAQIRDQLPGGASELFMFKNGEVQYKGVKWLMK